MSDYDIRQVERRVDDVAYDVSQLQDTIRRLESRLETEIDNRRAKCRELEEAITELQPNSTGVRDRPAE